MTPMNFTLAIVCLVLVVALVLLAILWRAEVEKLKALLARRGKRIDRLRTRIDRAEAAVTETLAQLDARDATVKRLRRRAMRAKKPVGGPAGDLVESGLPTVVQQAIAQAPVQGVQRQQLQTWAELELLALGWPGKPEAAQAVAEKIIAGVDGPEVDEDEIG